MTYRTILVELGTEQRVEISLPTVLALGRRFGASLIGLHVMPPPFVPLAWEGGASVYIEPALIEAQRRTARAVRDRAETCFRRLAGAQEVRWVEAEGEPEALLTAAARASDLAVAARPEGVGGAGLVEQLVLTAGVPVLMVPPGVTAEPGRSVLVGWNGTREATRAVHEALPFLTGAGRVRLLAVGERAEASLGDAVGMLHRHGVAAQPMAIAAPDGHAGEILLAEARTHGADLLVIGAYGHARLRELVFGGATRQILREAGVPVLLGS